MIDPNTALAFSLFENRGVYALLLGSGVSRAAQIPTGWEITLDLTRKLGLLEGASDQADWAAWHQERFGNAPNYSQLLDVLAQTQAERRALLHGYIEASAEDLEEGRRSPTEAHKAIARLVRDGYLRVIITTNFDKLLETALRAEGVEPTVVRSDDDLSGAAPLSHARCYVIKVHGDYLDTRLRNTEGELATYSELQNALLDRVFDEYGLIVCGWSSDWDAALRAAIIRAPSRRYPLYWASRGDPSAAALDLISRRDGKIVPIDNADAFFIGLQAKVDAQAARQRPNPLSVELLVATIKKQLARPEHRIVLGDTVQQEIKRIQVALRGPTFTSSSRPDPETFRARVLAFDAVCEPMVRIAFTFGRWGDGSELSLAEDMVLAFSERPSGSHPVLLDLATYPSVMIMWAYCLGAVKAERHDVILRMLHLPVHEEHRETARKAAIRFNMEAWSSQAKAFWETFDGMERRYLPACDVIHLVFKELLGEEFLSEKAFDLAWGWTEILFGLEFMADRTDKETLRVSLQSPGAKPYVPIGRMTYDSETGRRLLSRLAETTIQTQLARAGFADGDPDFVSVVQQYMSDYAGRAQWR